MKKHVPGSLYESLMQSDYCDKHGGHVLPCPECKAAADAIRRRRDPPQPPTPGVGRPPTQRHETGGPQQRRQPRETITALQEKETMETKTMVMYDSPEAATFKTNLSGWVSRDGHYYGDNEHQARWAGCTHQTCPTCGSVNEVRSWCRTCRAKKMQDTFATFPVEKWDGETPLCLFDEDRYFFGEDVLDYLADLPDDEEVLICKCKPGYLHQVDSDNWADDLPEEGELPDAVADALAALNEAIKAAGPVAWWQDAIAIDVADLRSRLVTAENSSR